jgi:hypothetical protein
VNNFKARGTKENGPEAIIQKKIIAKLTLLDWFVKPTHGNMYQKGFPDLYACHRSYGTRWIEVKNPVSYHFTEAQIHDFSIMSGKGVGIYVLVSDSDEEIAKLMGPSNWHMYLPIFKY